MIKKYNQYSISEDEYITAEISELLTNKELYCKTIFVQRINTTDYHFMQKGKEICLLETDGNFGTRYTLFFHISDDISKKYSFNLFDKKNKHSFSSFLESFSLDLDSYNEENKKT